MRPFHIFAALFRFVAMAFFLWLGAKTGDGLCWFMAGWCLYWGAASTAELRRAHGRRI
jgi:hypothetical protein